MYARKINILLQTANSNVQYLMNNADCCKISLHKQVLQNLHIYANSLVSVVECRVLKTKRCSSVSPQFCCLSFYKSVGSLSVWTCVLFCLMRSIGFVRFVFLQCDGSRERGWDVSQAIVVLGCNARRALIYITERE